MSIAAADVSRFSSPHPSSGSRGTAAPARHRTRNAPPHPALGREIAGEREKSHQTEARGKKGIESVEEVGDSEWASRRSEV